MLAGQKQTDFQGTLRTCSPILVAKTPFFSKIANSTQTNIFFHRKKNSLAPYWSIASTFSIFFKSKYFSVVESGYLLRSRNMLRIDYILVFDDIFFSLLTLLFAVKSRVRLHQDDFQSSKSASLRIHAQVSRGYWHPLYLTITRKNCHF